MLCAGQWTALQFYAGHVAEIATRSVQNFFGGSGGDNRDWERQQSQFVCKCSHLRQSVQIGGDDHFFNIRASNMLYDIFGKP
ncbi:hypothetical protein NWI01_27110 [Nitrobacter winogradskyi]|uniref:Uncharacterized protein n=1 Tax=Nitrobacter winogradskyi TaxID=913 RepID=A0A4Y3WG98_NITWI|nr:hypothetical protein NWI01_27110 [Nitrobacter winogradskyi]